MIQGAARSRPSFFAQPERRLNTALWERSSKHWHCAPNIGLGSIDMLKLSLVVLFVASLATLSFASSLMPVPGSIGDDLAAARVGTPVWVHTFE
jgi:hypothetical protein